ncbi:hypothetical protein AGMMS49975_25810 [Clostridia bacterium]|nr:hypothetical protein AGMMS49975_25810 [Clostridia bacterium]
MYELGDYFGELAGVFAAFIGLFIFIGLLLLVLYFVQAYGMYKMAKRRGIASPWLAYIPIANHYVLGALLGHTEVLGTRINPSYVLPISPFVLYFFAAIPFLGWFFIGPFGSIAYVILYYVILYRVYRLYKPENAVLYTILSVLFSGIAMPIIFFLLRNTELAGEAAPFKEEKNPFDN